jgi:hypothetical protein
VTAILGPILAPVIDALTPAPQPAASMTDGRRILIILFGPFDGPRVADSRGVTT